jgi:hypothetical protein
MEGINVLLPDPEGLAAGNGYAYLFPDPGYEGGPVFIHCQAFFAYHCRKSSMAALLKKAL